MSITITQLALYSGALVVLWLTPGPVWLAVFARGLSGGFNAVVPLAFGVAVGDILWPLLAILGLSALIGLYSGILTLIGYFGAALFVIMGVMLIRYANKGITQNKSLTRPGLWAGFMAGLIAVIANPKTIFFYLGLLPTFFDITQLSAIDIALICVASAAVPFLGNLLLGQFMGALRAILQSPSALRRSNIIAGIGMIGVGVLLAVSTA